MPCYRPITLASGQVVRCGTRCPDCRMRYSYEWAVRCTHEATLYEHNCFITLTYDDKRLPKGYDIRQGLIYSHFRIDFLKAFRDRCGGFTKVKHHNFGKVNSRTGLPYPEFHRPIRFYMSGEYGEKRGRPHWHACIFNFDFSDKYFWRYSDAKSPQGKGFPCYRSPTLEELWPYGNSEIGNVTFQSAGYCARYILKKQNGEFYDKNYHIYDEATGYTFKRCREFSKMSTRPGIGEGWFRKYSGDVFPHDYVVVKGNKRPVPRYYDRKFTQMTSEVFPEYRFVDPDTGYYQSWDPRTGEVFEHESSPIMDNLKFDRISEAEKLLDDNTPDRLRVKEQVKLAQLSRLKRTL